MVTRRKKNEMIDCIFACGGDYWVYETDDFLSAAFCHGQFYTMEAAIDYCRGFNQKDNILTLVID